MKTILDTMLDESAVSKQSRSCGCTVCREMEAGIAASDSELDSEANEEWEWREAEAMNFELADGSDAGQVGGVEFAPLPPGGGRAFWPLVSKDPKNKVITYRKSDKDIRRHRGRAFLDARSGYRHHMAVDLYAREGDEVIACEDGAIRSFYYFYRGVYALFVDHGRFVVNYGEVAANSLKRCFGTSAKGIGTLNIPVKAGQRIAFVGKMYHSSMLHLETYRPGTVKNERWCWKSGGGCKGDAVGLTPPPKILNPTKYLFYLKQYGQVAPAGGIPAPPSPTLELEWESRKNRPRHARRLHDDRRPPRDHRYPPRDHRHPPVVHTPPQGAASSSGPTRYLPIRLGSSGQSPVGVFIPPGFRPGAATDFLLYLHGYKTPCGMSSTATVSTYWQDPRFALREKMQAAGKNVILVVPTLGAKSETGWLSQGGGFDRFWREVLNGLKQQGALPANTQLGSLILSGHSGAGAPMRRILGLSDASVKNIREVWVFDGFYYGSGVPTVLTTSWVSWAKQNPDKKLYAYYAAKGGQPAIVSKALKASGLPNIVALPTEFTHCLIPGKFVEERVKGAAFLK